MLEKVEELERFVGIYLVERWHLVKTFESFLSFWSICRVRATNPLTKRGEETTSNVRWPERPLCEVETGRWGICRFSVPALACLVVQSASFLMIF